MSGTGPCPAKYQAELIDLIKKLAPEQTAEVIRQARQQGLISAKELPSRKSRKEVAV